MKKTLLLKTLLLFLFFISNFQAQQVAINEVVSSNSTVNTDEDGEFEDWIEIYNYGTTAVNLSGFGLSDQTDDAYKWVFPAVVLQAKEYLLVWASDKERADPNSQLHSNFKIKSGGEAIILTNPSGTLLSEAPAVAIPENSSYARNPDGTGGWEVFNIPTPLANNTGATVSSSEKIAINEYMASNDTAIADEDGEFADWIELYNYGSISIDLEGFGISDEENLPYKWVFPTTVLAPNQFILVWASDKDRATVGGQLHTNFKISSSGETLYLTNKNGDLISGAPSTELKGDVSYGRQPDGTGEWLFFNSATPLAANIGNTSTTPLDPPSFSHKSGLYTESFDLELTSENPNAVIIYTIDGSEPDINNVDGSSFQYKNDFPHEVEMDFGALLNQNYTSFAYSGPISISDKSNEADQLAIKTTTPKEPYLPPVPVRKSSVLRAKVYLNGIGSKTKTRNYFVWPDGNPYSVPIVAMTTFEANLFGYNDGIYTPGAIFDQWRVENPDGNQPTRAEFNNFGQSGRDWERNVNVQIFNKNLESILNQDAGLRIHGNTSRSHHLKNLRLYARSEYDEDNEFKADLFTQQIPGSPELYNDTFKRILLRGNGSGGYIANDVVFSRLMQPFFNGIMRIETTVNFINGEYFGISALRDRFDEHHIANNFGLDSDNVSIVGCVGGCSDEEGNAFDELRELFDYIKENNLQVVSNYEYVKDRLDIDSFINHLFIEIFSSGDSYETKFWKATSAVDDSFGDGRWRVYTQDFESAMKSSVNWLENFLEESNNPNRGLMGSLMKSEEFKNKLLNRFSDLLNSGFTEERFTNIVNYTFDEIEPLLDEDRNRSPRNRFYDTGDKGRLLDFSIERPADFREQLRTSFSIQDDIDVLLKVSNLNAGYITLNTIDVNGTTPGINDKPYPWSGTYFHNIPLTLEAKARDGYTFSHWTGASSSTNSKITITPTTDLELRAVFTPDEDFSHLLYFWLFDDEIENDKPLQGVNSTYSRNNLTAEINYNSTLSGYPFDETNDNWRKASLERTNKPTEINYIALANDNIPFAEQIMKGIQIKQPFQSGGLENNFELNFSTIGYEDLKVSLAISSNGAANRIVAEYFNGTNWLSTNVIDASQTINEDFELKEFDFSNITFANENDNFKMRFRFEGIDMTIEDGKEVRINNVAITAVDKNVLSAQEFTKIEEIINIYPNPTKSKINISSDAKISKILIYNTFGKLIYQSTEKIDNSIDISSFAKGIYLLKVFTDGTSITKKIIKN